LLDRLNHRDSFGVVSGFFPADGRSVLPGSPLSSVSVLSDSGAAFDANFRIVGQSVGAGRDHTFAFGESIENLHLIGPAGSRSSLSSGEPYCRSPPTMT